ncbi:MAG: hypothetical protein ACYDCO_02250 [Armatimonadota bacterium]
MTLQQRVVVGIMTVVLGLGGLCADTRTPPTESLNGLRPGTLTVDELQKTYGKPDVTNDGGLLGLYGGAENSSLYGWFMVENPSYTVPDLAVETAKDSSRVDLVMAIGYDGLKTEKGVTCFQSEEELIKAYGAPDFVFAVPMQGFVLRELYYVDLGISFDVAPMDAGGDRAVAAIYVTYPEYLQSAIEIRKKYIDQGVGRDITGEYNGVTNT